MNVYYSTFKLRARKKLNRLSSAGAKEGVYLKVKMRWTDHFAEYFPHLSLGDLPNEEFLEKFKYQDQTYSQKLFHILLHEEKLRSQKPKFFKNHELWEGGATRSSVIKYKIQDERDLAFLPLLKKKLKVRLDANGLFTQESLVNFFSQIPTELWKSIDYLEDPLQTTDWSSSPVPLAQDFIAGHPAEVLVHKPNCRFLPDTDKRVIFSSYMGSPLGQWHSFCELLSSGNLEEHHGILTPQLYEEEPSLFQGNFATHFTVVEREVAALYNKLHHREWKLLCSI